MLPTISMLSRIISIVTTLYAPSDSGPMTSYAWNCPITLSQVCSASACTDKMAVNRLIIRPRDFLYARCVDNSCESYPASFTPMSNSTVVTMTKASSVLASVRIQSDLSFTEILNGTVQVATSFGKCEEANITPLVRMK